MIIIGVDPGTATTGVGIIRKTKKGLKHIHHAIITTDPKAPSQERLKKLYQELTKIIKRYKPNILSVEKLYFFKNLKTALPVSEARGVILLLSAQKELKIKQYTPLEIKMTICGYGRAEKKQIQKMVKEILCMKQAPMPDDAADGLACAICAALAEK